MWKKVIHKEPTFRLNARQTIEYEYLESQLIVGMQENNLLPNPRKMNPSPRTSIFNPRGSIFGFPDSPASRQSIFSNVSSPASTPATQSPQKGGPSTSVKSLFADVDEEKEKEQIRLEQEEKQKEAAAAAAKREEEERQRILAAKLEEEERQRELAAKLEEERQRVLVAQQEEEERQRALTAQREEEERILKAKLEKEMAKKAEEERLRLLAIRLQEEERERILAARREEEERQCALEAQLEEEEHQRALAEAAIREEEERQTAMYEEKERQRVLAAMLEEEERQKALIAAQLEEDERLRALAAMKSEEEERKKQLRAKSRSHDELDLEFTISEDAQLPPLPHTINLDQDSSFEERDRRHSTDISVDFISDVAESEHFSELEGEEILEDLIDPDATADAVILRVEAENFLEQENSRMQEEDHDASVQFIEDLPYEGEDEEDGAPFEALKHQTSVSTYFSNDGDTFDAEKIGFMNLRRSIESAEDYHLHVASSHDSRYENFDDLQELHLLHEFTSSEVAQVIQEILDSIEKAQKEEQEEEEKQKLELEQQQMIPIHASESTEKEVSNKISSSYDTTDHADSDMKNSSRDTSELKEEHYEADEGPHEEHEEEYAYEESKGYEGNWQIDLAAHSDSELLDTDADNEYGYGAGEEGKNLEDLYDHDDTGFGYDNIHRHNSEFDEFPPLSEIILQTRTTLDVSAFSAANPLYGTIPTENAGKEHDLQSLDNESLTENAESLHDDSLNSLEFNQRGDSSVEYSDAEVVEDGDEDDLLQCAQVKESSDLPRCLNLANTQRTDTNINFEKYLSSDQFEKVRVLILKDNFFTDLELLKLRDYFPKLREIDLARNYLTGELTTKVFTSKLRKLDLSRNQLSNIKGLIYCKKLEELNISHNRIRFLDPLPSSLTSLDISCNWIDSATTFRSLSRDHRLQYLDISGNNIAVVKNIEWTIKTLVPGLLKCTIVYDRMLVKRRTSPRIKASKHSTPQISPKGSTGYNDFHHSPASPDRPATHKEQTLLIQNAMHVNPRLEQAVKALKQNEILEKQQLALKQENLKKAKEFAGKLREQAIKKSAEQHQNHLRGTSPSLIPTFNRAKFSESKQLQSQPSFVSEMSANSQSVDNPPFIAGGHYTGTPLKRGGLLAESFISTTSHSTHVTNRTGTTSQVTASQNSIRRYSNSSVASKGNNTPTNNGNNNNNGANNKVNGIKIVNHWLTKTQNRLNRCTSIFTMISELAKTELLLSATTHYGLLQEWTKIGFFDISPAICSFIPLNKPEFITIDNIHEVNDDYQEVTVIDIETSKKLWDELNDFHSLFIQIYIALEISILHQINFHTLLDPIMKTKIGKRINERLNGIYEFHEEESLYTTF